MKAVRVIGIVLVLWAVIIQVHSLTGEWQDHNRAAAGLTGSGEQAQHEMSKMEGMQMPAEQPMPMWRLLLWGLQLALMVALLWPIAEGRSWAVWALLILWLARALPHIVTDPRCWVAYDPTRHGCHLFMRSVLLAAVGLVLCGIGSRNRPAAPTT